MLDGIEGMGKRAGGNKGTREPEPPDYTIDPERRLVRVHFARKLTVDAIAAYAASLRQNPLFDPEFCEIGDLSAVEEVDITAEPAVALADAVDPFALSARRAFVAGQQLQTNVARLHRILRTPANNIAILDSIAKAEPWVCLELPSTPPRPTKTARVLQFLSRSRP
jgi:hypothetical protein